MKRKLIFAIFFAILLSASATAEDQSPSASPAKKPDPFEIKITGSWRVRTEVWDWFDTSLADGNYAFTGSLLRLGIGQNRKRWEWQVEIAQPSLLGLPSDAIAPAPQGQLGLGASYFASNGDNAASVFVKQGYIRLKGIGAEGNSLRLGRFEFIEGGEGETKNATVKQLKATRIAHRLIGNFGFSHVGRSFDGLTFNSDSRLGNFTLMGGRATRGVFHVDGIGELDVDVLYASFTRKTSKTDKGQWRVFATGYHDGRRTLKTDNRPLTARQADTENIRIGAFGGNMIQTFTAGNGTADLLAWGAWQVGRWGALDQNAGAIALEGGYQFPARWKPWLRAGWFKSSGDNHNSDQTHGTFFQMLPTPRLYARFPFFNLMNNEDLYAELILKPHPKLTLRGDAHSLQLSNSKDLWYAGGGAYEKTTFGYAGRPSGGSGSLANLFDISANFKLNNHWSVEGYFADAQGKTVIRKIYPSGTTGRFGYGEVTLTF